MGCCDPGIFGNDWRDDQSPEIPYLVAKALEDRFQQLESRIAELEGKSPIRAPRLKAPEAEGYYLCRFIADIEERETYYKDTDYICYYNRDISRHSVKLMNKGHYLKYEYFDEDDFEFFVGPITLDLLVGSHHGN
jgi:hypothetical protein